jgi:hypothetical protein
MKKKKWPSKTNSAPPAWFVEAMKKAMFQDILTRYLFGVGEFKQNLLEWKP